MFFYKKLFSGQVILVNLVQADLFKLSLLVFAMIIQTLGGIEANFSLVLGLVINILEGVIIDVFKKWLLQGGHKK